MDRIESCRSFFGQNPKSQEEYRDFVWQAYWMLISATMKSRGCLAQPIQSHKIGKSQKTYATLQDWLRAESERGARGKSE